MIRTLLQLRKSVQRLSPRLLIIWGLCLFLNSLVNAAIPGPIEARLTDRWQIVGTGYKPGTRQILFYEYHTFSLDQDGYIEARYIEYRLPDNTLKSIKEIDYSNENTWTPNFRYDDQEVGYRVGVEVQQNSGRLYRYSEKTSLEESREAINPNTVVDAGFDAYIQHVWPRLEKNEKVAFDFLAPLKLNHYGFTLQLKHQNQGVCYIEMNLDWLIMDLLFDPVQLEYDCKTRRLMRYQGMTNLRDKDHRQMKAEIYYQWNTNYPPFRFDSKK